MSEHLEPLRISQLDSLELDEELLWLLQQKLRLVFAYTSASTIVKYSDEITALLKLILWKFTVMKTSQTVGQRMLNLTYVNKTGDVMTTSQKYLYALLSIVLPYSTNKLLHSVKYISAIIAGVELVNLLVFLRHGKQQLFVERILNVRAMYTTTQNIRDIGFDYMTRELLWHGMSEFIMFFLPLINWRKLKNRFVTNITSESGDKSVWLCAYCDYPAVSPHTMGCSHNFCYYCLQGNLLADPHFSCPKCNFQMDKHTTALPATSTVHQPFVITKQNRNL